MKKVKDAKLQRKMRRYKTKTAENNVNVEIKNIWKKVTKKKTKQ